MRGDVATRLAARTRPGSNGCVLFTGAKRAGGYGSIQANGKVRGAHRVAYELAHGPIPDAACVLHRCDTPACVNPEHLWLGSRLDNTRDMDAKGRRAPCAGEDAARAKLTIADVAEIRRLRGVVSQAALGRRFGVSKTAVRYAQKGRNWGSVPGAVRA